MGSPTFPLAQVHRVAAASCLVWYAAAEPCRECEGASAAAGVCPVMCLPCTPHPLCRSTVSLVVHLASRALWPAYTKTLRPSERRQWCNKLACGLHVGAAAAHGHGACGGVRLPSALRKACRPPPACASPPSRPQAAVLSAAQARNLLDPVLLADPLHAVTGALARSGPAIKDAASHAA